MTIDSNIIIAYLSNDEQVVQTIMRWREEGIALFLSSVVETEVLSYSNWKVEEQRAVEQFLKENFTLIPFDRTLARIAAEIRRGSKIKFPDAAIAATALLTHTPLVTRNTRDFKQVPNL